jgi:hypothetical protein
MIEVNKIDEKNIEIVHNGKSIMTSAVFYAESHANRVYIKNKAAGNSEYVDDYKNIRIEGNPYLNAKDTARALNLFIGLSFKFGGTAPISTPIWKNGTTDAWGVLLFNLFLKTT